MTAAARAALPREAVGLVFGSHDDAREFHPLSNVADEETSFRIDDAEFLAATAGRSPLAFFHSHPTDLAVPSTLDIAGATAWPAARHLIFAFRPEETLRCWRIFDGQVMPEPIEILDS